MLVPKKQRILKIFLFCTAAAILNYTIAFIPMHVLGMPLFLDTIFTAVISFLFGFIPGLVTTVIYLLISYIRHHDINIFFICIIAEVTLVSGLKPAIDQPLKPFKSNKERDFAILISILARLMLLYITVFLAVSILGGLIDYIYYDIMKNIWPYYTAPDIFKMAFTETGLPKLAINILSRIPINIIDRFIVIFGGYFIARILVKFTR